MLNGCTVVASMNKFMFVGYKTIGSLDVSGVICSCFVTIIIILFSLLNLCLLKVCVEL